MNPIPTESIYVTLRKQGQFAMEKSPAKPRNRSSQASILLPPLLFFAAMMMGADFTAMTLRPLKVLQIPYPRWMDFSHFIIPAACALIWLLSLRKWPKAGAIVAVLLCLLLLSLFPGYIERYTEARVVKVPVTHWIDSNDLESIENKLGAPLFEQGSRDGAFVMVAPANAQRVRAELARLQLLGKD